MQLIATIIAISTAVAVFGYIFKHIKSLGREEIIKQNTGLVIDQLKLFYANKEKVNREKLKADPVFNELSFADLKLLKAAGYCSLRQIEDAVMRGELRKIKEGLR